MRRDKDAASAFLSPLPLAGEVKAHSPPPLRIRRDRQQRTLRDHGGERGLLAHLQRRGRKLFDDGGQPRYTEIAQRGFDHRLSGKVQPRKSAVEQGRRRRSLGYRERGFVQPCRRSPSFFSSLREAWRSPPSKAISVARASAAMLKFETRSSLSINRAS